MGGFKKFLSLLGIGEDRASKRIPTNMAIKYRKSATTEDFKYAICKNVSMLGVFLEDLDPQCLEGDRKIILEVPHPSGAGGKSFIVEGHVAHYEPAKSGKPNHYDCGVEFVTKQLFDTKMIKELVAYMRSHKG